MMVEYRVRLEAFEGPLDLLLFLIRRAEVDVHDIPVATIAEQYMAFLEDVDRVDIDLAGEFLVMAATLVEVKSRMLRPVPEAEGGAPSRDEGEREDPRADLVRQLLEYKKYRDAADALDTRRRDWERRGLPPRHGVTSEAIEALKAEMRSEDEGVDLGDVTITDLTKAFERILQSVDMTRLGEHRIEIDDTPIELHAADLLDRLRTALGGEKPDGGEPANGAPRGIEFTQVFEGRTRGEMLGLFLAMLELVRRRAVRVTQDGPGGAIVLELGERSDLTPEELVSEPAVDTGADAPSAAGVTRDP
ncbi:MAG: segregation/condensation protein A [Phycisphaerales bacterium]|jgi:segregation and condensation protein A|nr:segregation/condensation protein A [Phycisphaerales bacterium]